MQYTPKEAAYAVAIDAIYEAHKAATAYGLDSRTAEKFGATPSELKKILVQLAKLHDRLLSQSGLDGIGLSD